MILLFHLAGIIYLLLTKDSFLGKPLIVFAVLTLPAAAYLMSKKRFNFSKIIPATLVLGTIIGFTFDFIAEYTKTWTVIQLTFPVKILGVEPLDNTLWYTMMTFYTLIFYEYFTDQQKPRQISPRFKTLLSISLAMLGIVLAIFYIRPTAFLITYPYLTMGIIAIILPVTVAFLRPALLSKMTSVGIYFFFLYFLFEIMALKYNYWLFNGNNYIGTVNFLGLIFPFEELFFWMMFYAPTIIAFYEVFINE